MSETLFNFSLNELKTMRIHHSACGGAFELSIDRVSSMLSGGNCPLCGKTLGGQEKQIIALAIDIQGLSKVSQQVNVEFLLPMK